MITSVASPAADTGHSHGNKKRFITGSVLSILLTAIPSWLVMSGGLHSGSATALTIFAFAMVQIVVHVVYFLHVDTKSEGGWTLMATIFTAIIVMLTIVGSIWVMYHLDVNMMPMPAGAGDMGAMH